MLDATLVIYMNKINIPPIMIRKRISENQLVGVKNLPMKEIHVVCKSKMIPRDRGCLAKIIDKDKDKLINIKINISENSL